MNLKDKVQEAIKYAATYRDTLYVVDDTHKDLLHIVPYDMVKGRDILATVHADGKVEYPPGPSIEERIKNIWTEENPPF